MASFSCQPFQDEVMDFQLDIETLITLFRSKVVTCFQNLILRHFVVSSTVIFSMVGYDFCFESICSVIFTFYRFIIILVAIYFSFYIM